MKLQPRLLLAALSMLVLGACSPLYGPYRGSTGYSDVMLQPDMYDVSFVGADNMTETQAKKFALIRAAELTLLHGRQYFELVQATSDTRIVPSEVPGVVTHLGYGPHLRGRFYMDYYTPGYTVYYDRPEAFIRIHLLPAAKENALDARQIIREAETQDHIEFKDLEAPPPATTQPQ